MALHRAIRNIANMDEKEFRIFFLLWTIMGGVIFGLAVVAVVTAFAEHRYVIEQVAYDLCELEVKAQGADLPTTLERYCEMRAGRHFRH